MTQTSVNYVTGEMWIPAGILLAYFTDVRVWYVAGFAAGAIPDPVKRATARIVTNMINMPPELMGGLARRVTVGSRSIDRLTHTTPGRGPAAGNTIIDQNTMALLDDFRTFALF